MKTHLIANAAFVFLWISFINGCMKTDIGRYRPPRPVPYQQPPILSNSFIQEFDMFTVLYSHGWVMKLCRSDYVTTGWRYENRMLKPAFIGDAFSYTTYTWEYVYAGHSANRT